MIFKRVALRCCEVFGYSEKMKVVLRSLEKRIDTHSSILAWRIPWTEEPGGLQSLGSQRVRHDWMTNTHRHTHTHTHTHTNTIFNKNKVGKKNNLIKTFSSKHWNKEGDCDNLLLITAVSLFKYWMPWVFWSISVIKGWILWITALSSSSEEKCLGGLKPTR